MTLRTVRRDDTAYDDVRRALSASAVVPEARPAVVAAADDAADVAAALALARREGLTVTSRSGGHSAAFAALRDGVLALDLAGLDRIDIDATSGVAVVGPGVTSLQAARALRGTGWGFPVGHRASVGLGGYLLAGGNGWNHGEWGSAVESVLAADVVLADGTGLRIHADADPETFMALRGAGPGFPGIVTAFHLRLWPEPVIGRRIVSARADRVDEMAAWADALAATIDPRVELTMFLAPPGSPMHPGLDDVAVTVAATSYGRDEGEAERLLWPVAGSVPVGARLAYAGPGDIATMTEMETAPAGLGMAYQQAWSRASYADLMPPLVGPMRAAGSPYSSILVSSSSYRRLAPPATDPAYLPLGTITVAAYANWTPGADDPGQRAWPGTALDAVRSLWSGHYVGEVDLRQTPERLTDCFRPGVLDRIEAVRSRLDPDGLFAGYPTGD